MTKLLLGVDAYKHITDEVSQLQLGLWETGWVLCGRGLDVDETDVPKLLSRYKPSVVLLQDRREWDARGWRNPAGKFHGWQALRDRPDILRLSVLKDLQDPQWHWQLEVEAGLDGWVSFYHEDAIAARAAWLDRSRLIRTHHSVDAGKVPPFDKERQGCLLSGFVGNCESIYPLRAELFRRWQEIPDVAVLPHPGYGPLGCRSTEYLNVLSKHKIAICTASTRNYLLRKIVEAAACGCVVVTNLDGDVHPVLEPSLIRAKTFDDVKAACQRGLAEWDMSKQRGLGILVKMEFDYGEVGRRLDAAIAGRLK